MNAANAEEIELKLAVDDDAALAAISSAAGGRRDAPVLQENTFFDTASLSLDEARFTVRVRREDGIDRVTFKGPSEPRGSGGALSSRVEEEWIVSSGEAELMLAGELDPLYWLHERQDLQPAQRAFAERLKTLAGEAALVPVATFHNERQRVHAELDVGGGSRPVTLELDRTSFPDGSAAAEIELELEPGADAKAFELALRLLCERAAVKPTTTTSKAARVFAWVRARRARGGDANRTGHTV